MLFDTPAELWVSAVHEAGHALALLRLLPGTLTTVTLNYTERVDGRGAQQFRNAFMSAAELRVHLVCLLSGRAAEEAVFGEPSSASGGGPESDLAQATQLAATAVCALGFDADAGLLWTGAVDFASLPARLAESAELAVRVRGMLEEGHAAARELMAEARMALLALAEHLLAERVLDASEVAAVTERARSQPGPTTRLRTADEATGRTARSASLPAPSLSRMDRVWGCRSDVVDQPAV